jgi:hypothetical protein
VLEKGGEVGAHIQRRGDRAVCAGRAPPGLARGGVRRVRGGRGETCEAGGDKLGDRVVASLLSNCVRKYTILPPSSFPSTLPTSSNFDLDVS